MATEIAIVKANCRYRMPLMPLKKDTGTNTAANTQATPITGFCTFSMAIIVASLGFLLLYLISYSTASITTIASSTRSPIANTMAKRVNVLIVKSSTWKSAKVPSKDTGTAIKGIKVDRPLCKKRYTIKATSNNASMKVSITSLMDSRTKFVLSYITLYSISLGKFFLASSNAFLTPETACIALAPADKLTINVALGLPLYKPNTS